MNTVRSSDIVKVVTSPEALASFTQEEIKRMIDDLGLELNFRENGDRKDG